MFFSFKTYFFGFPTFTLLVNLPLRIINTNLSLMLRFKQFNRNYLNKKYLKYRSL